MSKQQASHVGTAVAVWGETAILVDQIYDDQGGEVDEGSEAAEALLEQLADEALEGICRFLRYLDAGDASIAEERQRLDAAADRIAKRRAWAEGVGLRILESEGRKSKAVGPFLASSKLGSPRLIVDPSTFKVDEAPEEILTITPPKPESRALNKAKAKAYLKSDDGMPVPGLTIERGPTTFKLK